MADTVHGACLCEAVAFSIETPTLFCGHCHCTLCQRNHGAGFVTWFGVSRANFRVDRGGDMLVEYASSEHGTRTFCGRCGTSLFCVSTHEPEVVDIVLAAMRAPIDREPQFHFYYSDRVDWSGVNDELPKLGGERGREPLVD